MIPNASIIVSVSNHYREATYASEVTSQGILGERVEIIKKTPLFTKIRQGDDYTSWISSDQVIEGVPPAGTAVQVRSHFIRIRTEPSKEAEGIKDAVIGCRLRIDGEQADWYKVILPDGQTGWAEKKHFGTFPPGTPENILKLAREFLGYQYAWGGRTPKGFDCSGFVQTTFGLHGITLPRDSWQQQEKHLFSDDFRDAAAGDLIFFGRTPDNVTHVAISLGRQQFIHASGWIRCNSLEESDKDFSSEHVKKFISVNRYPLAEEQS